MIEAQLSALRTKLMGPLPGIDAHRTVMSYVRDSAGVIRNTRNDFRQSAVLVLLYPHDDRLHTGLILRPEYKGVHSGQVAFPGGAMELEDESLEQTALRETWEEVGLPSDRVELLGKLSEVYIPPSNFLVQPFVGFTAYRPDFIPDAREVAAILEVPVDDLLSDSAIRKRKVKLSTGAVLKVDCFEISGKIVWGATAMMLAEFREVMLKSL